MKALDTGACPVCGTKLHVSRLACPACKAEFPTDSELSPFDYLDSAQKEFLLTFLKCKGNIKAIEAALGISYPTVNKRYEALMVALGLKKEQEDEEGIIDMSIFSKISYKGNNPSDVVKKKLYDNQGRAVIPLYNGDNCRIAISETGDSFVCDKLPGQKTEFRVFDIIVDFLKENGGIAPKGLGRGTEKVGYGKCGPETVIYQIATKYYGKQEGKSTFDPVFVLAAVLDWAEIAENGRGYLRLLAK